MSLLPLLTHYVEEYWKVSYGSGQYVFSLEHNVHQWSAPEEHSNRVILLVCSSIGHIPYVQSQC